MSVNPGKIELNSFGIQRQVDATHWLSGVFPSDFRFFLFLRDQIVPLTIIE